MLNISRLGAVLALGLVACSSGTQVSGQGASSQGSGQGAHGPGTDPGTVGEATTGRVEGPFYLEPGAPDPRACGSDADCVGDTVTDRAGCCVASSTPVAQSWAYHTWLSTHRGAAACAGVSCRVFSPSPPLDCEMTVRCVEGACVNTCP